VDRFCPEVGGGGMAHTIYTHVSKFKTDKIKKKTEYPKKEKKVHQCYGIVLSNKKN
jgi:hypothetical protein